MCDLWFLTSWLMAAGGVDRWKQDIIHDNNSNDRNPWSVLWADPGVVLGTL